MNVCMDGWKDGWIELLLLSSKAQLPATHPVQLHKHA